MPQWFSAQAVKNKEAMLSFQAEQPGRIVNGWIG